MGAKCGFKDLDDQVKEKFIDGVSKLMKFELLKQSQDLSLEKTIQLARTVETAMVHTGNEHKQPKRFHFEKSRKQNRSSRNQQNQGVRSRKEEKQYFCCEKKSHTIRVHLEQKILFNLETVEPSMETPPNLIQTNIVNLEFYSNSRITVQNVYDAKPKIMDRFAEVFSPGWGNFKGEKITLQLKPCARPKSLPVSLCVTTES
ncbi:hypothetical protein HHI36_010196 [Cryptolaemus montrouzieri]|uniref:Uncharacterized protein n=1 Tax=Cryptolaemus montrouzieri TaxID=559131 RepID=A0ABD2MIH1_9CUCU